MMLSGYILLLISWEVVSFNAQDPVPSHCSLPSYSYSILQDFLELLPKFWQLSGYHSEQYSLEQACIVSLKSHISGLILHANYTVILDSLFHTKY